ncbi:MAG: hypothetical protein ACKVZH_29605, partial [Blastocatellia bacterium]
MRLSKSSLFQAVFVAVISFSLLLGQSFSLRLASVSANPIKPNSSAPPQQVLSHSLATVKVLFFKLRAFLQGGINPDTMRNNTPQQPSYSQTGMLPA